MPLPPEPPKICGTCGCHANEDGFMPCMCAHQAVAAATQQTAAPVDAGHYARPPRRNTPIVGTVALAQDPDPYDPVPELLTKLLKEVIEIKHLLRNKL